MNNATLNLDFVSSHLIERAINNEIIRRFEWFRKLRSMKREGVKTGYSTENELFHVQQLNIHRRVLKAANKIED